MHFSPMIDARATSCSRPRLCPSSSPTLQTRAPCTALHTAAAGARAPSRAAIVRQLHATTRCSGARIAKARAGIVRWMAGGTIRMRSSSRCSSEVTLRGLNRLVSARFLSPTGRHVAPLTCAAGRTGSEETSASSAAPQPNNWLSPCSSTGLLAGTHLRAAGLGTACSRR